MLLPKSLRPLNSFLSKTVATAMATTAITVAASTLLAGQTAVVSAIGKNPYQQRIDAGFVKALDIPYFFTVPSISYGELSTDLTSVRTSDKKLPLVLLNYKEIIQENDSTGKSDLGLRLAVASSQDKRESVSNKLAESGLVKTGDIILSARPGLAGTIPYIHVQLGVTHAGMALVKKDKDGKDYVINVDMPLNEEMLGADRMSKFTSKHYAEAGVMFHIIRPKGITDEQRKNIGEWLELFRSKAKDLYKVKSVPSANEKYANKITFNMDYMNPSYDVTKTGDSEMKFVADLGRLALGKSVPEGLSMYCSEFAWSVLSLKDCSPRSQSNEFDGASTPRCINKIFEPMPVFGSLYENKQSAQTQEAQFGMSDGPIILADIIQAGAALNKNGKSVRQHLLNRTIVGIAGKNNASISQGHRDVEKALLHANPKFYEHVLGYYGLTAVPESEETQQQIAVRNATRIAFNSANKLNYSPTAFFMHAIVPDKFLGQDMAQKSMLYIASLYFLPPKATATINGQQKDVYQLLLNAAKETREPVN